MALTQALKWAKGSKTEHLHRQPICLCHSSCPKSPINLRRKNITKREMIQLLEVIWLPDEVAIVHWGSIKKDSSPQTQENNYADERARDAALWGPLPQTILELLAIPEPPLCFSKDTPMSSPKKTELLWHGNPSKLPWVIYITGWVFFFFSSSCKCPQPIPSWKGQSLQ